MKNKFLDNKNYIALFLIITLSIIFRFYNLHNWTFFGMDQEYEAFIAKNIVNAKHFPLIGVNASDTGLYLGPFFIYFASIPFHIFKGDPLGWSATASLLGVITTLFVYLIGKKMFSNRVGILSSIFYAGSFLVSFYDRQFWNPMPIPLFSILLGYFLSEILNNKTNKIIWLTLVFSLAIQCHLSILIFIPLIGWVLWKQRKKIHRKTAVLSVIIFLIIQSPLILFDIRHKFTNTKAIINLIYGNSVNDKVTTLNDRLKFYSSSMGRFYWIGAYPDLFTESGQCKTLIKYRKEAVPIIALMVFFAILFFSWRFFKENISKRLKYELGKTYNSSIIIVSLFFLTFTYIIFYKREVFEYYILYIFPYLAIVLGWMMNYLYQFHYGKHIVKSFILIFIFMNIFTLFTADYSYSYTEKTDVLNWVKSKIGNSSYNLEAVGNCPRFGGFRYLSEKYVSVPNQSYMDSYFEWLYKDEIDRDQPDKIVLLSLIDHRDPSDIAEKSERLKIDFLNLYSQESFKRFKDISVYILSPYMK